MFVQGSSDPFADVRVLALMGLARRWVIRARQTPFWRGSPIQRLWSGPRPSELWSSSAIPGPGTELESLRKRELDSSVQQALSRPLRPPATLKSCR